MNDIKQELEIESPTQITTSEASARAHEQWDLHNFYVVTQDMTDAELRLHRRLVKQVDPSLPQRSGRAYAKLERGEWKPVVHAVTRRGRRITVGAVVKRY